MRAAGFLFIFLIYVQCTSCNRPSTTALPTKPLVLASLAPYQLFAERIGGSFLDVQTLVPPGVNAHDFEPTPRSMETLQREAIWFRIGESFEKPLVGLFQDRWTIVDLREGVDILPIASSCSKCSCDHQDRHFWMSPKVAKLQASAIEQALSKRFPELSMHFRANFDALIQELDALDQELQNALAHLKGTAFLVSHPAFGYFCQDYGLHQISVEHEGKDLRPKHLNYLLKTAHELHPTFGITLPQHNNKGAELIAKELNIPLKRIDPYSHDYFEMMRNLTYSIQEFAP